MKKSALLNIFCSIIFATIAWAHGESSHIMGTVTGTGENYVVVTTPKGEKVSIAFHPQISFKKNGIHVKDARPQIGDRLVADVSKQDVPENRDWLATEISFVTPKK